MLRLVAYAPDGVRRFPVLRSELLIGSRPECDIYLPYIGVAQKHAVLRYDGTELRIEDLGSRKGTLVSGRKVRETALEVLDEIRVGGVTLLVEDVIPGPEKAPAPPAPDPNEVPAGPRITPERMMEHLARISEWVLADAESRTTSESLVREVLTDFGGGVLFLLQGEVERAGLKLVVSSDSSWLASGEGLMDQLLAHRGAGNSLQQGGAFQGELAGMSSWICYQSFMALDRTYSLLSAFPAFTPDTWSPVASFRTLGHLLVLGLVHHVGWYEPILPGRPGQQDLMLDPMLVVGESQAMKQVVEQMRAAVDPAVHVLLLGEPAVGKELLARSLHLSGPRRHGPFIMASCSGARPQQIEADLFGAEVPGKTGPVRREGKLLLAHGGTVFLDDVEQLPMEVQARLVRFLRSGAVEPSGSLDAHSVEVRVVAGSRVPLESVAARDLFRVDLAYWLSQFTVEVPPLRDRREDLPLLIQSYINRFCHETGKRMQGITVKAMSALLNYDYPGNLGELENIARQLVHLSPPGKPVDINLLPERVRSGSITTTRVDTTSDLDLERLVGSCEQSAIREALRRTHGNKSQSARMLGLSRNGLAIKMERYGLKG
jgi:transcriptional regulator with AAA-type ATPase domain